VLNNPLYPLCFDASSPATETAPYLQDPSIRLLVDFFRNKGLQALKREDRQEDWYPDWIDYQAKHKLYASLLSWVFAKQVKAFCLFARGSISALNPTTDRGLLIALGKCFTVIAYAQLVAENCLAAQVAPAMVAVVFHGLIEDLSAESLKLSAMFPPASAPRGQLKRVVRVPRTSAADLESVSELIAASYKA